MTKEVFKWLLLIFFYIEMCNTLHNLHHAKITKSVQNGKRIKSRQNNQKSSEVEMSNEDILRNTNDITKGLRSYENLIGQLRYNWQMPSTYLEKRGYLINGKPMDISDSEKVQGIDSVKGYLSNTEYESNKLQNGIDNEEAFVNEGMIQQTRMTPNNEIVNNFKLRLPQISEQLQQADEGRDVIFVSDKRHNDNEDDDQYNLRNKHEQSNSKNDKRGLVKKNPFYSESRPMAMTSAILSDLDTAERNIKFDDLFSNLSKADIDYVKSFLKCFRENKKQFIIDYLHINETENAGKPGTKGSNETISKSQSGTGEKQTGLDSTNATSTTNGTKSSFFSNPFKLKSKSKGQNATSNQNETSTTTIATTVNTVETTTSASVSKTVKPNDQKGKPPSGDTDEAKKLGIVPQNVKLNIDLKSNNSGEVKFSPTILNKLNFLIHLQRSVNYIDRLNAYLKVMNIQNEIQEFINSVVVGEGKKCTPIRLKEMSFDLEVAEKNSSDKNYFQVPYGDSSSINKADDVASHFLAPIKKFRQIPLEMKSPYADNFLDQSDGEVYDDDVLVEEPLVKVSKKRQALFEEQSKHNNEDSNSRKFSKVQDYYLDYPEQESDLNSKFNEYEFGANDDSNKVNNNFNNQQRNQKQKLKSKRKKKGKRTKNFNVESNDSNNPKLDATAEESSKTIPKADVQFPELSDIKFRINQGQEEAIEKFIESLNSPPEVFSFDVGKYLKEPENRVAKNVLTVNNVQPKTFYEFPSSPRVENEQVPFIPKDSKQLESDLPAGSNFRVEQTNDPKQTNKRDLLRQFIKGVSNNILDVKAPETIYLEVTDEQPFKNENSPTINEEPRYEDNQEISELRQNYFIPNNQYMNVPLLVRETKQDEDDFIDKYYLLNDGKSPFYKTQTTNEMKARYDPQGLNIDLDLEKKFKDLKYGKRDFLGDQAKKDKQFEAKSERSAPLDVYLLSKDDNNAHIDIPQ